MFFLSRAGLGMYDGSTLKLLSRDALYETMRLRMGGAQDNATACVCGHVYVLAMCVRANEGDVVTQNNTVVEFDTERGTFMIRKGLRVKDFFEMDGVIYYTQAEAPYDILRYNDPDSASYLGQPMESVWETPWLDLGKAYMKRDFVLRFTADADENDVPVTIRLVTDRREKKKTVLLARRRTDYCVKIQSSGVRVKLIVSSRGKAAGWRIYGGIQVEYSVDEV